MNKVRLTTFISREIKDLIEQDVRAKGSTEAQVLRDIIVPHYLGRNRTILPSRPGNGKRAN